MCGVEPEGESILKTRGIDMAVVIESNPIF
jgi:hypothetical protein